MVQYHVTYDKVVLVPKCHIFSVPFSTIMITTYNLLFLIVILNCIAFVLSFVTLILQWFIPWPSFLYQKYCVCFLMSKL